MDKSATLQNNLGNADKNENKFSTAKDPKMSVQHLSKVEATPQATLQATLQATPQGTLQATPQAAPQAAPQATPQATPLHRVTDDGAAIVADVAHVQAQAQVEAQVEAQAEPAPSFVESEIKRLVTEQEKITTQIRQLERTGFILLGAVEALKGVHANTVALAAAAQKAGKGVELDT